MSTSASEAVRGNAGIILKIGVTDYSMDTKAVELAGEDADDADLTFTEAASGGAQVDSINITGIQSTAAGSLWRYCWENAGNEVAVTFGPHGNAVATEDKPHFLMTVKLGNRPNIGGEARRGKERNSFETVWEVLDGPELVEGA